MTVAQARTGSGARTDNHAARLAAIQTPRITAQHVAAAKAVLRRTGNQDLADMLGLDEGSGQCTAAF